MDDDRDSLKYLGCDRRSLHSRRSLETHGVRVHTSTTVTGISRQSPRGAGRAGPPDLAAPHTRTVDLGAGRRRGPPGHRAGRHAAGARLGCAHGAIAVDEEMRATLPGILAAGDCLTTDHWKLGPGSSQWPKGVVLQNISNADCIIVVSNANLHRSVSTA